MSEGVETNSPYRALVTRGAIKDAYARHVIVSLFQQLPSGPSLRPLATVLCPSQTKPLTVS